MMEVMLAKKLPLSKLAEPLVIYPQVLKNVAVKDKQTALSDADVAAAVKKAEQKLGNSGRILVRPSGTEPVVRVMVEAESMEMCNECVDGVVNTMKSKGLTLA